MDQLVNLEINPAWKPTLCSSHAHESGSSLGQDSGVGVLVSRGHTLQHSAGGLFGSETPLLVAGCVEEK